jgi:excisionase family DNA binding protein
MRDQTITTGEIADYCQVSRAAAFQWIKEGKIPAFSTPGGHYRVHLTDFRNFLEKHGIPIDPDFFNEGPYRVLVVDDERDIVDLVVRVLGEDEDEEWEFATAFDGFGAGLKITSFKPELLIIDLVMPNLNGFEVCRRLRTNPQTQDIQILVITSYPNQSNVEELRKWGIVDIMCKPLDVDALKEKALDLLQRRRRSISSRRLKGKHSEHTS